MASKPGSKYHPLFLHLQRLDQTEVTLSFASIETLMGTELPPSARRAAAFWSNRKRGGYQAAAWMDAGYHVEEVDLRAESVRFRRVRVAYSVEREGGTIRWDSNMIRALRAHMDLKQEELADLLGVRQQTVSEWENEIYQPSRARSKHLTLVAERAEFPFGEGNENGA